MALTRPRYSQIYDTDYKQSVRLATTADVGNLFAGGGNITNTVDSTTVLANDRILVKNQNDARQNGIYRVVTPGNGSNGTWIRALDADASDKVTSGMTTVVTAGSNYAGTTWKLTTPDPIALGTTELTFINPFQQATPGAAGSSTQVQYNTTGQLTGSSSFTFNETGNVLTVAGNVVSTSGFFIGNGSQLTGIDATLIQSGTSSVRTYSSSNVAISVGGSNVLVASSGNLHLSTGIMPTANVAYDLGSPTRRWRSGYFSGGSLHVGNLVINESTGGLSVSGNLQVTGNLTVDGDLVYLNVDNIRTEDSLLYLAHNNSTDFIDIGVVGIWSVDGNTEYGGLVRDATDGVWKFFEDVSALPTTTVDFGGSARSSVNVNHLLAQGNVLCAANLTVGGRLNAGGSPGTSGQYLTSSGTGISWTSIDFSTLTNNDLNSFNIADNEWGNLQINSYQVAQFSPSYTNVTADLIRLNGNVANVTLNPSATIFAGNATANITIGSTTWGPDPQNQKITIGGVGQKIYFNGNSSQYSYMDDDEFYIYDGKNNATAYYKANQFALNRNDYTAYFDAGPGTITIGAYVGNDRSFVANLNMVTWGNATVRTTIGNVGISTTGNCTVNGTMTATSIVETSSATLKENINPITDALGLIAQLQGVTYDRRDGSTLNEAGLIAEEVNRVLPNLVSVDDQGRPMGVYYTKLTAYLIEAVKALKAEIDQLKGK